MYFFALKKNILDLLKKLATLQLLSLYVTLMGINDFFGACYALHFGTLHRG